MRENTRAADSKRHPLTSSRLSTTISLDAEARIG